ncbi:hypothetical protein [Mycobacterium sp. 236(2023)]|uniref:hypothetical protein n=1 Tax=Mycobacterium sp. 236(2023) TaxID=3038163 RepID=UPI0024153300|nr:hypothetical protein [Mycobacterium sp. 236(2023)]MDG4663835.1 hypothetical protein [Mycobacterium sp. 236(2023)]
MTEQLRCLPDETVAEARRSGLFELLLPLALGGQQTSFPAVLEPVRRLGHGCTSSAWPLGFYALRNRRLALFDESAQDEIFDCDPVLAAGTVWAGNSTARRRWAASSHR